MIFNLYKFTHLILKICIFEYFIDIKCQTGSISYFLSQPQAQPQPQLLWDPSCLRMTRGEWFVVWVFLNYKTVIPSLRGIPHNSTLWDPSFLRMTRRECFVLLVYLNYKTVIPSLRGISCIVLALILNLSLNY